MDVTKIVHPNDILPKMVAWSDIQSQYDWYVWVGRNTRPERFLEIGVAAGYSSYAILEGCLPSKPKLVTWIDFCDGHGWDGNHDYALGLIRGTFGIAPDDRIINSKEIHSFASKYDLIHVDGDHTFDGCLHDARLSGRSLAPGGHIVFHDTNDPNVRDAIELFSTEESFNEINMYQVRCGMKILHRPDEHFDKCPFVKYVQQMNIKGELCVHK